MSHNFFKDARSISNSFLCRYDSTDGYASDFSNNGDVDGWDLYNNVYLYGSWGGMVFGTSYDRDCYIGRSNPFSYIEAETHFFVRIMMKVTSNQSTKEGPTTGKIRWTRYGDTIWDSDKEYEFDVTADARWHLYEVNMGPAQWWQGDINNIRVYPFIDGWSGDEFAIKYIRIGSLNTWNCTNTQCSYYSNYTHPCPGAGSRGSCQAGKSTDVYNTVEDVDDELVVNINGYGNLSFNLGTNKNLTGVEMARVINGRLSAFSTGGYAYSVVEYVPVDDELKIYSGTVGSDSSVSVVDTPAARVLGFYDEWGNDISNSSVGTDPATGFDYASARLLTYSEINRLLDEDTSVPAYIHNPSRYSVEGGRRDFFMVGEGATNRAYERFENKGTTLIDISHPFDNNGRVTKVYVYGVIEEDTSPKLKLIRPTKDGALKVISDIDLPEYDPSYMYTNNPIVYRADCDILVEKGDYIGVYNMDIFVGQTYTGDPDATFFVYDGDPIGSFTPDTVSSYGLGGFPIYARGDRRQTNTTIDIDMGERINIEEIHFYGKEYNDYMEYNIACCLDVNWSVDLFGQTHRHHGVNLINSEGWTVDHQNIAVGTECLSDCIITADNGKAGDGLEALTGEHSYFYVTGDAEWGYRSTCNGTTEFCGNQLLELTSQYERDPVEFRLDFPYGFSTKIHKSIMYFKDSLNFRNFSLTTRRDRFGSVGDADIPGYDYIGPFTSVSIDGIPYDSDGNIAPYLFNNPTNSDYIIINDVIQNKDEYRAAVTTRWNILEHKFDPISSTGFRIFCDKHSSTKITELELYSKFDTVPALNDNLLMSYSTYGDAWLTVSFEEDSESEVSAFIGGAPRYFRVDIEAQSRFRLDGMKAFVGDQVKLDDCNDYIYMENSKTGVVNESQKIEIENVYDVALDLNVTIPTESMESDDIIFWSKAGSNEELSLPEIGPPALLRQRRPYTLMNKLNQCAINNPCYGLKNMVNDKKAYYKINESSWVEYGTLSSGVSIDYSNYPDSKKTTLSFGAVSSKFWKINTERSDLATSMLGISAFYGDTLVDINKVYFSVSGGSAGGSYYSYLDDSNGLSSMLDVDYTFGSGNFTNYFSLTSANPLNTVTEDSNGLYASYIAANSSITLDYTLDGSLVSFDAEFVIDRDVWNSGYFFDFNFVDSSDTSRVRYILRNIGRIYSDGVQVSTSSPSVGDFEIRLTISRRADTWTFTAKDTATDGSQLNWSWTDELSDSSVSKLKIGLLNYDITGGGTHYVPITNDSTNKLKSVKITAVPYFSDSESIIVELYSSQPLDSIVLFPLDSITPGRLSLYISNTNSSFYGYVSEDGLSNYTTLVNDNFTGTSLDTSVWNTYIVPNASVTVNDALELNSLIGDAHSGAIVYTKNNFTKQNAVNIRCKWKPNTNHYDTALIPSINIFNPNAARGSTYGELSEKYIAFELGYYRDTNNRTRFYMTERATGSENTVTWGYINIDESQWHDIDILLNFESGNCYFDLDNGTYNFYGIVSQEVLDSIGSTFAVDFENTDFNKTNTEYFDDIYIGQSSASDSLSVQESNYYIYFGIDLENRHDVDIVRNYGNATNKLLLSISNNTDFSNSFLDDPNQVDWDNSTYNDVRWLRIPLLCGDGTDRIIRKLGIYPDIGTSLCHNGGYNCNWQYIGNFLTDYTPPINVVSAILNYSNYVASDYPTFAIDNDSVSYWGFYKSSTNPFIEVDLGDFRNVDKLVLYFGSADENIDGLITDYTISASTTTSGDNFVDIVSVNGNSYFERTHYLSIPTTYRRVKFTVDAFDAERIRVDDVFYNVGYLRGFEVWTAENTSYIDSETWPVVCVDLIDAFFLAGHELVNKDPSDTDTDWDNTETFFRYAESARSDPNKVAFYAQGDYQTVYYTSDSSGDMRGDWEYTFDSEVYFHEGQYIIEWQSYHANNEDEISIRLEGSTSVDAYAETLSTSWASQKNSVFVEKSGYYAVKAIQHIDNTYNWGARYINIYKSEGHYRWVAVTRDTAENYSYDDDSDKYGEDYLAKIKVFSVEKPRPTEYSWWWESTLSSLSNDYIYTKEGERSLCIEYPTSSGIDTLRFIEGDSFGVDEHWSVKDFLTLWLHIDNVSNVDTSYGYISFGIIEDSVPKYYTWNVENMGLTSGWNNLKLQFENADSVSWYEPYNTAAGTLYYGLDFKNNGEDFESFAFSYRGVGNEIRMCVDDIRITRPDFESVKFDKGLCLFDNDFLEIPVSRMSLDKGTIEFWYKFYTDTSGYDIFDRSSTRTLFTATNNNNDFIAFVIAEYSWFQVLVGNLRDVRMLTLDEVARASKHLFSIGDTAHFAVVWSNDGSFMDNGDTLRLYINNELVIAYNTSWEITDTKSFFLKFGGAVSQTNMFMNRYSGCGTIDNIKLYNYCKDSFDINMESNLYEQAVSANKFLEISDDNVNFYEQGNTNLPLSFEKVPVGAKRSIYLRSNKDDSFIMSSKTANLLVEWISIV